MSLCQCTNPNCPGNHGDSKCEKFTMVGWDLCKTCYDAGSVVPYKTPEWVDLDAARGIKPNREGDF